MKPIKQLMIFLGIFMMCLGFAACSAKEAASNDPSIKDEQQKPEPKLPESKAANEEETIAPIGSDPMSLPPYSYELEGRNWNVKGITVKYPMIVNSNVQEKADKANDLIMNDMSQVIGAIKSNVDDETLTIDGVFKFTEFQPTILSIMYDINYSADSLAYPVNLCHTITISLEQAKVIPLSDLFVIDEAFVEDFKSWMYAPYRDDLDLEASGVSLKEEIEKQYTNEELIKLFSAADATYYLAEQGLFLSIGVSHVLGDHLEMAMKYEFLEVYMKRDHPAWRDYMFLDGDSPDETVENIDVGVKAGEIFTATLDENPSTGYSWQYKVEDETIVGFDSDRVLLDESKNNDEPVIVGAGSQHEWKFKGLKSGLTTITFEYSRSWENEAAITVIYTVTVE